MATAAGRLVVTSAGESGVMNEAGPIDIHDVVLPCGDDVPFRQDGTRQNESFRRLQQDWHHAELSRRGIESHTLAGSPADRIDVVSNLPGRTE